MLVLAEGRLQWDRQNARFDAELSDAAPPALTKTGALTSVAVSSDGRRIDSGSADKTLRFWGPDTGQQNGTPLIGHSGWVSSVAFNPDGHVIVSGSTNRTLRLWPGPAAWPDLLCDKLTGNVSRKQWRDWVSQNIGYITVCPGLPILSDSRGVQPDLASGSDL
jgi:WD40 repeat protein